MATKNLEGSVEFPIIDNRFSSYSTARIKINNELRSGKNRRVFYYYTRQDNYRVMGR